MWEAPDAAITVAGTFGARQQAEQPAKPQVSHAQCRVEQQCCITTSRAEIRGMTAQKLADQPMVALRTSSTLRARRCARSTRFVAVADMDMTGVRLVVGIQAERQQGWICRYRDGRAAPRIRRG